MGMLTLSFGLAVVVLSARWPETLLAAYIAAYVFKAADTHLVNLTGLTLMVLAVRAVLEVIRRRSLPRVGMLDLVLAMFYALYLGGTFAAEHPQAAVENAIRLLLLAIVPYMLSRVLITTPEHIVRFFRSLFGFALAFGALVVAEYLREGLTLDRMMLGEANPIPEATLMAYGIFVGFAQLFIEQTPSWLRVLSVAGIPVMGLALLLTGSRGPVLALSLGVVLYLAAMLLRRRWRVHRVVGALTFLGAVLYLGWRVLPRSVAGRFTLHGVVEAMSLQQRLDLYAALWNRLASSPFVGFGYYRISENIMLEIVASIGFIGLVPFLALVLWAALRAWHVAIRSRSDWPTIVLGGLALAFADKQVSYALHSTKDLFIFLGLAATLARCFPTASVESKAGGIVRALRGYRYRSISEPPTEVQ